MRALLPQRICLFASLVTVIPIPLQQQLESAKNPSSIAEKITVLRRCLNDYPLNPKARAVRDQLVTLLLSSNRYDEALREYRKLVDLRKPTGEPDLKLLELLLKTGHYRELLFLTAKAPYNGRDFLFDKRLFEFRVQAFLAKGLYRDARMALEQWLAMHTKEGLQISRFEIDVQNLQKLRRYLLALERIQGDMGKSLFTASVPDSLQRWSRNSEVPIYFFKLVPADPSGRTIGPEPLEKNVDESFRRRVEDMNKGFIYLSGGAFSLAFRDSRTLYIKKTDLDFSDPGTNVLISRVYVHTLAPLYRLAGKAFVVLVDYRAQADSQAAYMGDGIIHIAAGKLSSVTLMHEILHGLGATHQEWNTLTSQGYTFNAEDRGLMTFSKGELHDLGLEEKNRILLDWPRVETIRLPQENQDLAAVLITPTYASSSTNSTKPQ